MIIKFQEKDAWVMFGNVEHLEYVELKNVGNVGVSSDVLSYPCGGTAPAVERYVGLVLSSGNVKRIVHAHSPIYLMNDNGKTIEVI